MQVILLERIPKLGQMGETVRVRDGFARNFLLPQGKALRANDDNRKRFERERVQLEAKNLERRQEAEKVGESLNGESFITIRQAGETGQLYGSVSTRDISEILTENGFTIGRNQVEMHQPIKALGIHEVSIRLHPEVAVTVTMNVARSQDEAERQARGENVLSRDEYFTFEEEEDEESEGDLAEGETAETDAEDTADQELS
ncbi:50S ribosomal protein L9 [Amorphus orientalis]|uniref:Large ribosomal subunit protein bL9 n=1 Tax=Amorphus orientalis TaxID=649198 RepID=A0AAE4AST6_9HYPH|nr:50S ribosomal protein L9 [Amorphus orientalis]MDQ0315613.1 large subunit ribosomal protein L9 [Amorphus orientalis]